MERAVYRFLIAAFVICAGAAMYQYFTHTVDTWRVSTLAKEIEYQELLTAYTEATTTDGYVVPSREYLSFPFVEDSGIYITSHFHLRTNPFENNSGPIINEKIHHGLDITSVKQNIILATIGGVVVEHYPAPNGYWRGDGARGGKVVIEDVNGVRHSYSHLSDTYVSSVEGKNLISTGDPIGRMGDTGLTTGPHLHYEIYEVDSTGIPVKWYDPIYYFDIRVNPTTGEVMFPKGYEDELTIDY